MRVSRLRWVAMLAALLAAGASPAAPEETPPTRPPASFTAGIPPRSESAPGGAEFVKRITGLAPDQRRQAVLDELLAGNIPDFLRRLRPVELRPPQGRTGSGPKVVIWVAPDYLAVGSDEDFVRVPLGLYGAVNAARGLGFSLPTRKMVDAIFREADVRLAPQPMPPGPNMTSVAYLWEHHRKIEEQLAGQPRDALVAGHKKDLVLTNRLQAQARKVAIYGWHRKAGDPIQSLSTVHVARYRDYSHGVRLVATTVYVGGQPRFLFDLLEDPAWASWLSYEGTIPNARKIMALPLDLPANKPDAGSR